MRKLDISDNLLVTLDQTFLKDVRLSSLEQLNVSKNQIRDVHKEAFAGQGKLQTVDLSSNNLMFVEPNTFKRNPSIEILSLSNNQDLTLPEGSPFLYSISLRILYLVACNLSHIPPNTFRDLPNLQELYISHNNIEVLHPVQNVGGLTMLDVGHNRLTDLKSDIFTASPKLIHLNLRYNKLSTLNTTVLVQLVNVSTPEDLNGNPWVCDCITFNTVYSWCRNNGVDFELVCSSPPKCKGKLWTNCYETDCDGSNIDVVYQVEEITRTDYTALSGVWREKDGNLKTPHSFGTQIQGSNMTYEVTFMYVSISLFVVCVCLLAVLAILYYCLKSRPLKSMDRANGDAETCRLSSTEIEMYDRRHFKIHPTANAWAGG